MNVAGSNLQVMGLTAVGAAFGAGVMFIASRLRRSKKSLHGCIATAAPDLVPVRPMPTSSTQGQSDEASAVARANVTESNHDVAAGVVSEASDVTPQSSALTVLPGADLLVWLEAQGLAIYGNELARYGYDDLQLLHELTEDEVQDLLGIVRLLPGHAVKLRKRLARLRGEYMTLHSPPTSTSAPADGPNRGSCVSAARATRSRPCASDVQPSTAAASGSSVPGGAAVSFVGNSRQAESSSMGGATHTCASSSSTRPPPDESSSGLAAGMRATLYGLERRPELNGLFGSLVAWDAQASRWEFKPDTNLGTIKVRVENVRAAPTTSRDKEPESEVSGHRLDVPAPAQVELRVPDEFRCCITQDLMERPVITADGHTYERAAIARWLEDHTTSPKTGQELADTVLRPNHQLRGQIIAWRERQGLPPLPPWEPEPQELVQRRATSTTSTSVPAVTVQTPAGSITLPLAVLQAPAPLPSETWMVQAIQSNPALHDELLAAWQDESGPDMEAPSFEALAQAVGREPRLTEIFMRWAASDPEARAAVAAAASSSSSQGSPSTASVAESPLFRAAREGECGAVEQLLGYHGGERLQRDVSPMGDTLLHVASWWGHPRLVSMLIARGHPIHCPSRNRSMPLHYAAFRGHVDVVRLLLDARAEPDRRMMGGDAAIHQAAWQGHTPVLRLLLERQAKVGALKDNGDSALALASSRGHADVCRELLLQADAASGIAQRNHSGRTPLHAAASSGNAEIVQLLVEAKAPASAKTDNEEMALHLAVQANGNSDAIATSTVLLEAKSEVDVSRLEDEHTPLELTVLQNRAALARLLLEHQASLNTTRRDGMAPLHFAVISMASHSTPSDDSSSVLAVLMEARAELDARARCGMTPLHVCLGRFQNPALHRSSALRALVEHRADIEAPSRLGDRPLHLAVASNLRVEAAILLEHRADVNATARDGGTALHTAARCGARECAEMLMRAGADLSRCDSTGLSPADVACLYGLTHVERLLRGQFPASNTSRVGQTIEGNGYASSDVATGTSDSAPAAM